MAMASRVSMSRRCIMNTSLPSRKSATEGDDGGYGAMYSRARSVASAARPSGTARFHRSATLRAAAAMGGDATFAAALT